MSKRLLAVCLLLALAACADGGSSVAHPAGTIPAAAQQGSLAGAQGAAASGVHSGARRTLSVPGCSGMGTGAFIGSNNTDVAAGAYSIVGSGQDNGTCDSWSSVVGGFDNVVSGTGSGHIDGFIGGGENNVVTGADLDSAVVAGNGNTVSNIASAIVGGKSNAVATEFSFVGGGETNTISSGDFGFVGGGQTNTISSGDFGAIAGGTNNAVSGEGAYVGAGGYNTASGEGAVVDGGFQSTAAGNFATIPGGYGDSAAGTYSFAAGARASAAQTGAFVWSDGSNGSAVLASARAYQFLARASGGVTFYTNAGATVGASLAPGSGTWASASDRNLKTDVARIDDAAVLDKVAALPIEGWSYKSERGVRHVGPMAQDFYAAFKVGEDDRHITSIDEDGVALAAIKALHAQNAALRAQQHDLRAEVRSVRLREAVMQREIDRLALLVREPRRTR